jgi:hypothetical protein
VLAAWLVLVEVKGGREACLSLGSSFRILDRVSQAIEAGKCKCRVLVLELLQRLLTLEAYAPKLKREHMLLC